MIKCVCVCEGLGAVLDRQAVPAMLGSFHGVTEGLTMRTFVRLLAVAEPW